MKICALADLHGYLPGFLPADDRPRDDPFRIEPCDLLLIAGDICPVVDHSLPRQARFLDTHFRQWLEFVPASHIVGIAGNHDLVFENAPELLPKLPWNYLQDDEIEIDGLRIYGTPWQPPFFDWAFNLPESELAQRWARIPEKTDILVVHGPPRGFGDRTTRGSLEGSPTLLQRIGQIKPRLTVFGHIHEGRGRWDEPWGTLANVTLRDVNYKIAHPPMYFSLELDST